MCCLGARILAGSNHIGPAMIYSWFVQKLLQMNIGQNFFARISVMIIWLYIGYVHDHFDHVLLPKTEDLVLFENKEGKLLIFGHRRIQGGAKGARAPCGSKAKTVKSACFWLMFVWFHHSAPHSTPVAWNPAYASVGIWSNQEFEE